MEDNKIYITDENGNEKEMNILFTFDANDKNYVVCYEGNNEDDVFAFSYDEDGNLYVVEDEEEVKIVEEVLASFDGTDDEK